MIPKEIITRAIEGGWNPWRLGFPDTETKNGTWRLERNELHLNCDVYNPGGYPSYEGPWFPSKEFWVHAKQVALDKTFWQALKLKEDCSCGENHWIDEAVEFTKLVLTNGDTEKFWKEILT